MCKITLTAARSPFGHVPDDSHSNHPFALQEKNMSGHMSEFYQIKGKSLSHNNSMHSLTGIIQFANSCIGANVTRLACSNEDLTGPKTSHYIYA